jgi:hypothetical protein
VWQGVPGPIRLLRMADTDAGKVKYRLSRLTMGTGEYQKVYTLRARVTEPCVPKYSTVMVVVAVVVVVVVVLWFCSLGFGLGRRRLLMQLNSFVCLFLQLMLVLRPSLQLLPLRLDFVACPVAASAVVVHVGLQMPVLDAHRCR